MLGTAYLPYEGSPDDITISSQEIEDFISEVNAAYPRADLSLKDVLFVHRGLVPAEYVTGDKGIKVAGHFKLTEHGITGGADGLISVMSVKYTTGRHVAEKIVDTVLRRLGRVSVPARTASTAVHGGRIDRFDEFLSEAISTRPEWLDEGPARALAFNYGSEYRRLLQYAEEDSGFRGLFAGSAVTGAEIIHAVREEMAQKLTDVVLRRTELGTLKYPGDDAVNECASIMSSELHWSEDRKKSEVDELISTYSHMGSADIMSRGGP